MDRESLAAIAALLYLAEKGWAAARWLWSTVGPLFVGAYREVAFRFEAWKREPQPKWADIWLIEGSALVFAAVGLGYAGLGPFHGLGDGENLWLGSPVSDHVMAGFAVFYLVGSGFLAGEGIVLATRVRRQNQ